MALKAPVLPPSLAYIKASGHTYPDKRHEYTRTLWCKVRQLSLPHNLKKDPSGKRRTAILRACVAVALHPRPLRTAERARCIDGVGDAVVKCLKDNEGRPTTGSKGAAKWYPAPPPPGKFSSPASAALVALLEHEEAAGSGGPLWCSLERLLREAGGRLEDWASGSGKKRKDDVDKGFASVEAILAKNDFDPAWEQVKQLLAKKLVKERMFRKGVAADECGKVYDLLPEGRAEARRLRAENLAGGVADGPMISSSATTTEQRQHGFSGIVKLLVDFREGGGEHNKLHKLTELLDHHAVPYEVRSLPVGDFAFQYLGDSTTLQKGGRVALLPVIVERKEARDVAASMMDDRWESQQRKMLEFKRTHFCVGCFSASASSSLSSSAAAAASGSPCELVYLIEGNLANAKARCTNCGRGCLGACGGPTLAEANSAIEKLEGHGYTVIRTTGMARTVATLVEKVKNFELQLRGSQRAKFASAATAGRATVTTSSDDTPADCAGSFRRHTASLASSSSSKRHHVDDESECHQISSSLESTGVYCDNTSPGSGRTKRQRTNVSGAGTQEDAIVLLESTDEEDEEEVIELLSSPQDEVVIENAAEMLQRSPRTGDNISDGDVNFVDLDHRSRSALNALDSGRSDKSNEHHTALDHIDVISVCESESEDENEDDDGQFFCYSEEAPAGSGCSSMGDEDTYESTGRGDDDDDDDELLNFRPFTVAKSSSLASSSSSLSSSSSSQQKGNFMETDVAEGTHAAGDCSTNAREDNPVANIMRQDSLHGLKERCRAEGLAVGGSKAVLAARLLGPRPPEVLQKRKLAGDFVPRANSSYAAILVALLLYEDDWIRKQGLGDGVDAADSCTALDSMPMLHKAEIMHRADETGVSSKPMEGLQHDNAIYHYDGWSGVKEKLLSGARPLLRRRGRDQYALTTMPAGTSGRDVARALHRIALEHGSCKRGTNSGTSVKPLDSPPTRLGAALKSPSPVNLIHPRPLVESPDVMILGSSCDEGDDYCLGSSSS